MYTSRLHASWTPRGVIVVLTVTKYRKSGFEGGKIHLLRGCEVWKYKSLCGSTTRNSMKNCLERLSDGRLIRRQSESPIALSDAERGLLL